MDNKLSTIKERILFLVDYKGYKKESFFKELGLSYGNFKGENKKRPLNSNALANIFTLFPDVNLEWLLIGKGEMLKPEGVLVVEEPLEEYSNGTVALLKKKIDQQDKINKELNQKIERLQKGLECLAKR